jgi:hypothetical protein
MSATHRGKVVLNTCDPEEHRQAGTKRKMLTTLMFAVSSSRHKNALLARERFRMAATEQGRRHNHQNDG